MPGPETSPRPEIAASGIPGLDEVLKGGFRRDRIYLVEGTSGSGKTTLALQFVLEGARRGERCLYFTLAETPEELTDVAASHGWSLDGITVIELLSPGAAVVDDGAYSLFPAAEVDLHGSLNQLRDALSARPVSRVVIDPLSAVRLLAGDPAVYRKHLLALREILAQQRCTVLLVDDSDTGTGLQPRSLAHGILSMQRRQREYGPDRRLLTVTKYRGMAYREGYHDLRIVTGGIELFPRLFQRLERRPEPDQEPLSTGLARLDSLLGGGLDPGTSLLIGGAAGTGKSSLAVNLARAAISRGERVAYFLFDERESSFLLRNRRQGQPVDEWMDRDLLTVRKIEPAEMSAGQLSCEIRNAVERDAGVRMVVLDSVSGYLHAMSDSPHLDLQLHELLGYLGGLGIVSVMILAHRGVLNEAPPEVDLSYIADSTLMLRFFEARGEVRRAITVQKRRTGGHERTIRELRITDQGLEIGEPLANFEGVLTGRPRYLGAGAALLDGEGD